MNERNGNSNAAKKRNIVIAVILALVILAAGITIGAKGCKRPGEKTPETTVFAPDIDDNAGDWQGQKLPDKGDPNATGIKIPGYPSISIPADTKTVDVAFLNPEGNPCYFVFNLVLDDTKETIYTSKMVPPGQAIYSAELIKPLSKGEYKATIQISTYSIKDGSAMNGANVETTLVAE